MSDSDKSIINAASWAVTAVMFLIAHWLLPGHELRFAAISGGIAAFHFAAAIFKS